MKTPKAKSDGSQVDAMEVTESMISDAAHTSSATGETSRKNPLTPRQKTTSRLNQLKTQHFLEMFLSLRDKLNHVNGNEYIRGRKGFGFYVVMNKVFVCCLNMMKNNKELSYSDRADFCSESESLAYKKHSEKQEYFEMKCAPYLDIFNPVHFRALMMYIQFLVWHEYTNIFF